MNDFDCVSWFPAKITELTSIRKQPLYHAIESLNEHRKLDVLRQIEHIMHKEILKMDKDELDEYKKSLDLDPTQYQVTIFKKDEVFDLLICSSRNNLVDTLNNWMDLHECRLCENDPWPSFNMIYSYGSEKCNGVIDCMIDDGKCDEYLLSKFGEQFDVRIQKITTNPSERIPENVWN